MSLLARLARVPTRCPPTWKVTRAVSEPWHDPEIAQHLETCARCARQHQAHRDLVTLARALPDPGALPPESRQAIAAALWGSGSPPAATAAAVPRRRLRRVLVAAALPAAAALALAVWNGHRAHAPAPPAPAAARQPRPSSLATIQAFGNARFLRAQAQPDEIVRLYEGRIALDITPLKAGERFRVLTDDAVVEVRGTSFELTAQAGKLVTASVSRGRVEVKAGQAFAVLDAGDRWERAGERVGERATPVDPAAPPGAAIAPVHPARKRAHPPERTPARRASTEVERAIFARGWSSLRAGKPADAAATFAELEQRAHGSSLEEDALYWRAVAEARRHDEALAARLFQDFLTRFPRSGRQGEAAAALGWLLLHASDVAAARRAFEQAAADPSPVVRASASEGLRRTK